MNDKVQYADMIEMPVNSCSVVVKPVKRKKTKTKIKADDLKDEVLKKVNKETAQVKEENQSAEIKEKAQAEEVEENTSVVHAKVKEKKKFKISAIGVQLTIIGALIATILLTSALNENSGINTFFRGVFGSDQVAVSTEYFDFAPVINMDNATFNDGVITISGRGSVYSSCDGVIKSLTFNEDSGKYSMEIEHSDNFISVFNGLDYAYGEVGGKVFGNIPVGYIENGGCDMCFFDADGSMIVNYQLVDGSVIWAV